MKFKFTIGVTFMTLGVVLVYIQYREEAWRSRRDDLKKTRQFDKSSDLQHQPSATTDAKNATLRHRLPQIIGIGGKKCGTGAFREFLNLHSQVRLSTSYEPHYFNKKYDKGVEFYKSQMPLTTTDEFTFEKTPMYIVTKAVPQRIIDTYAKEGLPTPKFVWVVCDPVQKAFSDFSQTKRHTDEPDKRRLVGEFNSFDDYVNFGLAKIKTFAPPSDNVYDFYPHMDSLFENRKLRFLLRGIYSYFFQHWLNFFPPEDIVIINGDQLLINPGKVMVEAQEKLGLKVEVGSENFVYVPEKGLYCVKINSTLNSCLDEKKGLTRNIVNGTVAQPTLSGDARMKLEQFYKPFMEHFRKLMQ